MPPITEHVVLRDNDVPNIADLDVYIQHEGYEALRMAIKEKTPADIITVVKDAGLRGRGGAGFPTGVKWGFLPKDVYPRYLSCNADESEPGTFNNHQIIDRNPHQLIEGVALAAYAIECQTAFIYIRGEFAAGARRLEKAIADATARGFLGKGVFGTSVDINIVVHRGAGAYICGEETAQLESLEGKIGQPRLKPPFPAVAGLYGKPTIINNVETLANVPRIVLKGVEWYRKHGTEKSPGTKVFSVSGHVRKPGNYEVPFGVIILDETVSAVELAYKMDEFFKHESCGKCTPCREGTTYLVKTLHRLNHGGAQKNDIAKLHDIYNQMAGNCFCLLGESAVVPIRTALKLFPHEFEEALAKHARHDIPLTLAH